MLVDIFRTKGGAGSASGVAFPSRHLSLYNIHLAVPVKCLRAPHDISDVRLMCLFAFCTNQLFDLVYKQS